MFAKYNVPSGAVRFDDVEYEQVIRPKFPEAESGWSKVCRTLRASPNAAPTSALEHSLAVVCKYCAGLRLCARWYASVPYPAFLLLLSLHPNAEVCVCAARVLWVASPPGLR